MAASTIPSIVRLISSSFLAGLLFTKMASQDREFGGVAKLILSGPMSGWLSFQSFPAFQGRVQLLIDGIQSVLKGWDVLTVLVNRRV